MSTTCEHCTREGNQNLHHTHPLGMQQQQQQPSLGQQFSEMACDLCNREGNRNLHHTHMQQPLMPEAREAGSEIGHDVGTGVGAGIGEGLSRGLAQGIQQGLQQGFSGPSQPMMQQPQHAHMPGMMMPGMQHGMQPGMQQGTQQRDWLEVFVDSARGLPKTELIFKGDPYCILSLGGVSKRTTVKKRTHEPVWDENFSFDLPMDWRNQSLTVEVFDKDRITKDDFLGRTQISLGELEQELLRGSATVVRTLTHPKASGEIKLRFVLHSAGGFGEMGREGLGMNKNLPVEETMMPSQPLRTQ